VTYADQTREAGGVAGVNSVKPCENNVGETPSPSAVGKAPTQGNQRVSYNCGNPGHVQKRCFVRLSSKGKTGSSRHIQA
jgi:hypothetical protein